MAGQFLHIYIADDDDDDCLLFGDVLLELEVHIKLTTVSHGVELMAALESIPDMANLPDLLFLDLNMPIKNGMECLLEIKQHPKLRHLPVIIYSTSAQKEAVDFAYKNGAALFFKKPDSFIKLKQVLKKVLAIRWNGSFSQPSREEFLIEA